MCGWLNGTHEVGMRVTGGFALPEDGNGGRGFAGVDGGSGCWRDGIHGKEEDENSDGAIGHDEKWDWRELCRG